MQDADKKKEIVSYLLQQKVLVTPSFLQKLSDTNELNALYSRILAKEDARQILQEKTDAQTIYAASIVASEEEANARETSASLPATSAQGSMPGVKVLFSYKTKSKKRTIQDFIDYYNARFKLLEKMLQSRQELNGLTSVARVKSKKDREHVAIIGMVKDKQTTKNNNIVLEMEDPTGVIKTLITKNKPDAWAMANDMIADEVIGITGMTGTNIIFANNIILPDIPMSELKKAPDESYVVVLADLHVGSTQFLEEEFKKFISWIRQETGSDEQKAIADKVKYIFIIGDLVDGVGIYPKQEDELKLKDIHDQFKKCAELLAQIPSHIPLLICPGNHDPGRISEPQPPLPEEYAKPLYELKNAIFVSNPATINIHATQGFPGFNALMYHGYSFDDYASEVSTIRSSGGYDRGDLIMKYLLQRRHLAPAHASTLHLPDPETDPLVIDIVPDFFLTGHIHKTSVMTYRSTTMICASCWQAKTKFQEKVGHNPEPCRVPIINLQTRNIKIMRF